MSHFFLSGTGFWAGAVEVHNASAPRASPQTCQTARDGAKNREEESRSTHAAEGRLWLGEGSSALKREREASRRLAFIVREGRAVEEPFYGKRALAQTDIETGWFGRTRRLPVPYKSWRLVHGGIVA
jgi:hypothetical protein